MDNLITNVDILDEIKDCFLVYADEVLTDRAIPYAEDGCLSVQRKLIWTIEEIVKMNSSSKHKKSASLVGTTLSTAYFHGDTSCYGAMCKMAQKYLMRYPLIDGEGNFGSQEANGMEGASRYTEARPSIYSDLMMTNFKKNIVPLKETYNGEYYEPVVLPALFPNAIANGREAIGISMSHNSLPNNLTEVCNGIIEYIKNPEITLKEMMEYIKGPDFPLGGTVVNKDDIYAAFATGHSSKSLKVRGDYVIEDDKIIFTSIPYRTYRNKIKEQISKNIDELEKYIDDFYDESNVGENKLVFYVKNKSNIQNALSLLFSCTDLQTSLSYNMNFIVNGTPKLCSLLDLIKIYTEHQHNMIIKSAEFDKSKAEKRLHILEGILVAIKKIDAVITLIKESANKEEAKQKLIDFLSIDEIQANAILDMKLSKLTKLDKEDLLAEIEEKKSIISHCIKLITDVDFRNQELIKLITEMRNKYGDERRTKLTQIETDAKGKIKEKPVIPSEDCIVLYSIDGEIKRVSSSKFKTQRRNGKGNRTKSQIQTIIRTNTTNHLLVFTNLGKMYKILVNDIDDADKFVSLYNYINFESNEKPITIYSLYENTDAKYILFTTKSGMVKKTALSEFNNVKRKNGIAAIKLKENDSIVSINLIKDENIILCSRKMMAIKFSSTYIAPTGRVTAGVKGISLKNDDYIVSTLVERKPEENIAIFTTDGNGKQITNTSIPAQTRAGKGVMIGKDKELAAAVYIDEADDILIAGNSHTICISASDIPIVSKTSIGNQMIKDKILSVSKIT